MIMLCIKIALVINFIGIIITLPFVIAGIYSFVTYMITGKDIREGDGT